MSLYDYRAKTYEEALINQYTNCVAFLSTPGFLDDQEKEQVRKLKTELKTKIIKMMEGK
jgi:hypothetical protein